MIYGAILAGGSGTRIKSSKIPKQFIEIEGKPIILYTINNMLAVDRFDFIYVAVHKDYYEYMKELVEKEIEQKEKVIIIYGGKERMDSIHNVTDAVIEANGLQEEDIIVIHDSVRPFVTKQILNDSIDSAARYGAVVAALPASDTILHSTDGEVVSEIPDRSMVFHGQAPDSFNLKRLIMMQENLTEEQKKIITGTSQVCTFNGQPIHMIPGDAINFKITTDSDLLITKNIITKSQNNSADQAGK